MTFLNPFILFGLIASSIPIIIHLLNLRKLKKIEFSTITFLKELQKNKIRKIKIKQILLLILRTLIIMLLVLTFARPVMKGYLTGLGSHPKTSVVIILDDSFSMNVTDESGQLFKQAKISINKIIDLLEEGDDITLLRLSDISNPAHHMSANFAGIKKDVENFEPAYKFALFSTALKAASNILGESKNFNKEIYLVSDNQKTHFTLTDDERRSFYKIFDNNTRIYFIIIGKKKYNNLSITNVEIKNRIFEKDKPVALDITVKNYGDEVKSDGMLSIYLEGKRVTQKNFNIQSNSSVTTNMSVIPKNYGCVKGYAEIEDDALPQDNRGYFTFTIPEKINILMLSKNSDDNLFLKLALNSANSLPDTGSKKTIFDISETNASSFASYNLADFNVVILTSFQNLNKSDLARIKNFSISGGGLIIFPGDPFDLQVFNNVVTELGLPNAVNTNGNVSSRNTYISFSKIDYDHPIFWGMLDNRLNKNSKQQSGMDSPEIFYSIIFQPNSSLTNIIEMSNNSGFLYEFNKGNQKTLLFAVAPNLGWSDFPLKGIFLPLICRSVFYLTNSNELINSLQVGDVRTITYSFGYPESKEIYLKNPLGIEEKIKTESTPHGYIYNFNNSNLPGIYEITDEINILKAIPVNINPMESDLTRITKEELINFLKPFSLDTKYKEMQSQSNFNQALQESRFGVELWKSALIIAIILIIFEMMIARDSKKQIAELNK